MKLIAKPWKNPENTKTRMYYDGGFKESKSVFSLRNVTEKF